MTKIISLINNKGGVGKTTSTVSIGYGLANVNKKVLLIDLDPQANTTIWTGINTNKIKVIEEGFFDPKVNLPIYNLNTNIDIIPCSTRLLITEAEAINKVGREFLLKRKLEKIKDNYDYILIDCPPALGVLTTIAMMASTDIIVPLEPSSLALYGFNRIQTFFNDINDGREILNMPKLNLIGVLITKLQNRNIDKEIVTSLIVNYVDYLFKTKIRSNVSLIEACALHQDIFTYKKESTGAIDYNNLVNEILLK